MNKRGLSNIVTMVLIILLVLIAIGLLWFFLKPFIFNSSQELEGAGSCFQTTIEPTNCLYTQGLIGNRVLFLSIKREGQEANISGFDMIFTTDQGELRTFRETQTLNEVTSPQQFETRRPIIEVNKTIDFTPASIKIAIILGTKGNVCPPFSQEIACAQYIFSGRGADINQDLFLNGIDFDLFNDLWAAYCGLNNIGCINPNPQSSYNVGGQDYNYLELISKIDFNEDTKITDEDYAQFLAAFNDGYCPTCIG